MADRIGTVAIIGGGVMGGDIAASFASGGGRVYVMSPSQQTRDALPGRVKAGLEQLSRDPMLAANVTATDDLEALPWKEIDLVIEAVTEDLPLKLRLFADLERLARPEAILATNTSSFPIGEVGGRLKTRSRMLGMHYFMPAHVVPLVEVVKAEFTDDAVVDAVMAELRRLQKAPIRCNRDIAGFIGNRLQHALMREALYLIENGITDAEGVDTAVRFGFGFRFLACGPILQKEMSGWDTNLAAGNTIYPTLHNGDRHGRMVHELVASGRLGTKTKEGLWKWTDETLAKTRADYNRKLKAAFELLRQDLDAP